MKSDIMKTFIKAAAIAGLALSSNAFAGEGPVSHVLIDSLSILNGKVGLHIPGNMEFRTVNAFTLPAGVVCDRYLITTRKTADADRAMFSLASRAQAAGQYIGMYITDDPAVSGYPGRCSLLSIGIE